MNVVLLRVGIDTGCGGIHGPLFQDGTFEYIPIPDGLGVDERTYGSLWGRYDRPLVQYFPPTRRGRMMHHPVHVDPEFGTCTYGDPTGLKSSLRRLMPGDLLVFYCGLRGWDHDAEPALYLMGYLEVRAAGLARDFGPDELHTLFAANFHVRHPGIFTTQRERLVLVKGGPGSRLFRRAVCISENGRDRRGIPLKVLSREMQAVFGNFGGRGSIQRSPPRWVAPGRAEQAADYVRSLA